MRNLKFPEIEKKVQQSIYGAWGGSNSNEPPPNGGWFDNGDGMTIISNGSGGSSGGSGSSDGFGGSWDFGNNGSYDNGGYWGDTGGGVGTSASTNYADPHLLQNLPDGVPQQFMPGSCVQTSASFVAQYFGSVQSAEYMMSEYGATHNMNQSQQNIALYNGLGHDQQVAFLLQQFYMTGVTTVGEITGAIDRGHPVMGVIMVGGNVGHEVTIVGYNNDSHIFTIADTSLGHYSNISYTDINTNLQSWEITGIKP